MLCVKCKKNMAVVFVSDPNKPETMGKNGYCISCARELGIAPVDEVIKSMGITPEQLEEISSGMNELAGSLSEFDYDSENIDGDENSPIAFMNNLDSMFGKFFGGASSPKSFKDMGKASEGEESGRIKTAEVPKKKEKKRILDSFGTNLTLKAKDKLIDRIIGRDKEIDRTIQILNRRTKNNPVLLGEPGVGKTAIAEGLAVRICEKRVPAKLYDKEVYLLDFTAIVAGTQFRGQFEARLKKIIEEAKSLGNIILVIDELHNIVGAGDAEGAMSAANILKPALARGEIQVLGATTLNEYRKTIEKDSALERRFQPVIVDEPSVSDTIEILKGIKDYYENFHRVIISDEVIRQTAIMSERYITDRFLPDKAIDILDEAGSKANLTNEALIRLTNLKIQLKNIQNEKDKAVSTDSTEDYQKAAELKMRECALIEEINKIDAAGIDIEITTEDVAAVIEDWTKIPVRSITEEESVKLMKLEERLSERVIGQSEAISKVSRAIRRNRARLTKARRPVSFIFAGPTGVGKTELAKTLAEVMFDSSEAMIRIDMSEYMEKHTVSKLIGAPPGYVGYDEAGQLTEKVRRKPYSIILLDEIEKAHPEVFNILLQILDDGRVADSHGRIVNFENTIIIMTSNAGSEIKSASYGFGQSMDTTFKNKAENSLKEIFRPEFLNRIDDIIAFNALGREELVKIVDIMLSDLALELMHKDFIFKITDEAKEIILERGFDAKYGARPLRRTIEKLIENQVAELVICGKIKKHSEILADAEDGEIKITVKD